MNTKSSLNAAEKIAVRIAKRQAAADKRRRDFDILGFYSGKTPKAPEPPKRHSTDITRYYE